MRETTGREREELDCSDNSFTLVCPRLAGRCVSLVSTSRAVIVYFCPNRRCARELCTWSHVPGRTKTRARPSRIESNNADVAVSCRPSHNLSHQVRRPRATQPIFPLSQNLRVPFLPEPWMHVADPRTR